MADHYTRQAFECVIQDAKPAETWYVSLMQGVPFYGGPEEGGWWGEDRFLVAYKEFHSEEAAEAAAEAVRKLAKELEDRSRKEFGEHCSREMEWLDQRGLDADFLPEPDGPDRYYVVVSEGIPEEHRDSRHYE